jgi:hypothetical protein
MPRSGKRRHARGARGQVTYPWRRGQNAVVASDDNAALDFTAGPFVMGAVRRRHNRSEEV